MVLAYNFNANIISVTEKFKKMHKYTLGKVICDNALSLITTVSDANHERDLHKRISQIDLFLSTISRLQNFTRLSVQCGVMPIKNQAYLVTLLDEMKTQATRWKKYCENALINN